MTVSAQAKPHHRLLFPRVVVERLMVVVVAGHGNVPTVVVTDRAQVLQGMV